MINQSTNNQPRSDLQSLKRLWQLAGPLKGKVLRGIFFRFAQSLALGFAFGVMIWVVTSLIDGRPLTAVWIGQIIALMIVSLIGQMLFGYLSAANSWSASYALASQLRMSLLDHLRKLPMGFHLSRHKGDTVSALTSDMQAIEGFLSDALPRIAQAFGIPLMVLAFLAWRDFAVALAAFISILLSVPIFLWSNKRLSALGIKRQDGQADAAAHMIEYVQGISVIKAYNLVETGQQRFYNALKAFRDISIKLVLQLTVPLILFAGVLSLGIPLIMLIAGWRFFSGAIDLASLVTFLILIFSAYAPLLALISVMEQTRIADAALIRLDRIAAAKPLLEPTTSKVPTDYDVAFQNVGFSYIAGNEVLQDVSFKVKAASTTAIIGASGSGKSTILNLIARFWDVNQGSVTIGGIDVRDMDEATLNQMITVVFQDVYLFAGTIYDNIAFGREAASKAEIEAASKAANAHDFIMALPNGYQTLISEAGSSLSGGERQRISIARAILKDAPIVLLDEATAAIDASNERAIQQALAFLVANKTLILVAHKLSTIQSADEILVLNKGKIIEQGSHQSLLAKDGTYRFFWERRKQAENWHINA